jgi:hypothetical protein
LVVGSIVVGIEGKGRATDISVTTCPFALLATRRGGRGE